MTDRTAWAVRVPATSANIGPGFDSLGIAVDRHLFVGAVDRADVRLTLRGEGQDEVASGDDNLIWRSLQRFCAQFDVQVPDVSLVAYNEIPLERGMGSSSAAIVAGLVLGRALTGVQVGLLDLVALACEIEGHPDNVAPALLGGFVAATTDQDGRVVVRRAQPRADMRLLLAVPTQRQNTNEARGGLPDTFSRTDTATQASRAVHTAGGIVGAWPVDPAATHDLLHEPTRLRVMAGSGALIADLRAVGAHVWLSGAGPCVAASVPAADDARAQELLAVAGRHPVTADILEIDLAGALACPQEGCAVAMRPGCAFCPHGPLC